MIYADTQEAYRDAKDMERHSLLAEPEPGHTPEPWPPYIDVAMDMTPNPEGPNAACISFEDYERARVCVNACAGMTEPEAEIAALRKDSAYLSSSETLRAKANEHRDELLAACRALIGLAEREGWIHVAIIQAKAAIAKAEA